MRIRVGFDIAFHCEVPVPMVLMLSLHPSAHGDRLTPECLTTEPAVPLTEYRDLYGNICHRVLAPAGPIAFRADFVVSAPDAPDPVPADAVQHPVEALPDDTLLYLLPSRYADTEKLSDMAWREFGHVPPGWGRVTAILDYVHARVQFGYPFARADRTAFETHEERQGVCRDFAHLALALCRCMNIPARYVTGWLGDIRWPVSPCDMDFSGWFQVYLGDRWWDVDARHNTPRYGRVLMAVGRDAADVAITTHFGRARLDRFVVIADELDPPAQWAAPPRVTTPPPMVAA